MHLSVVVLTFQRPDALELVLRGLARQRVLPDEVVVTEDGAEEGTRACLERVRAAFPVQLRHLTQEHAGPRMSRARNRGIAAARGDYLVFLDGDMIPGQHLVADHRDFARPGAFAQASRALASERLTRRLLASGEMEVSPWTGGLSRRRNLLRIPLLRQAWGRPHRRRDGAKSCNFAFWRSDLLALNGFNEGMEGWGLEDAELVQRAFHLGLWRRVLRLGAPAIHLWHPSHALSVDNPNWAVLREVEEKRVVRCSRGLDAHLY
jgi:GT2 family glycosyltransferase